MTDTTQKIRIAIELRKLAAGTYSTPTPPKPPMDDDGDRIAMHLLAQADGPEDPSAGPMPPPVLLQFTGSAGGAGMASLRAQLAAALVTIDKAESGTWLVVSLTFTPGDPPPPVG